MLPAEHGLRFLENRIVFFSNLGGRRRPIILGYTGLSAKLRMIVF